MKTTLIKPFLCTAILAILASSCVNDDTYGTPTLISCTETTLTKNREVSQINAATNVAVHANIVPGVSDIIEAYVTSSDIAGNFFKTISFQTLDGTKAFSIPVDDTSLFINFEPGRKVLIKLDDLYTDINDGAMRIGGLYANSSGGAEVGRLPRAQFLTAVNRSCTVVNEAVLVQKTSIKEATSSDMYLNKLIEFENVQFDTNAIAGSYYNSSNDIGGATNLNLMDLGGNTIVFRTSSYSNFAAKPVAKGSGKVRGVLTKYGSTYQFLARSENDVQLTNARFKPLLNEGFISGIGNWTTFSVTGAEVWTYSSTFGYPGLSSSGGMMKMSGFASTNKANEDWLISPAQDLSALKTATLSLENAYKFTGNPIEILVSNNYSGTGSPKETGVTWVTLTGAKLSTGNYVYVNTGALSLASFVGTGNSNVYIAIKYTSTTSAASTWEIDNVKIEGN